MLTGFTAALLLITISELGDKTFFIAVILSLKNSRIWVFWGAVLALTLMSLISIGIGHLVAFLPTLYVRWAEFLLFFGFGVKLLLDSRKMSNTPCLEEEEEALEVVNQSLAKQKRNLKPSNPLMVFLNAFSLTFVAEWGDRTQLATITMAAVHPPLGVMAGSVLGYMICVAIAVNGGRLIAQSISEKMLTLLGGCLFLLFALNAAWYGLIMPT